MNKFLRFYLETFTLVSCFFLRLKRVILNYSKVTLPILSVPNEDRGYAQEGRSREKYFILDDTKIPINIFMENISYMLRPMVDLLKRMVGTERSSRSRMPLILSKLSIGNPMRYAMVAALMFSLSAYSFAASVDLEVTSTVSNSTPTMGSTVSYTVTVKNHSTTAATNVLLEDILPVSGLSNITGTSVAGTWSFNSTNGIGSWMIPSLGAGQEQQLTITGTVIGAGVYFNVASVKSASELDSDSSYGNYVLTEDDIAATCFSVPIRWVGGDEYTVSIPSPFNQGSGLSWFINGTAITAANASQAVVNSNGTLTIKAPGTYTFTGTMGSCPVTGCCAIIVNAACDPTTPFVSANPLSICVGENSTLTANNCNGIVKWSNGQTGASITVNPSSTTDYTATCTIDTCRSPVSNKATVVVTSPKVPIILTDKESICEGGTVNLSASNCDSQITWTSSDGTISQQGNNLIVTPTKNTTYTANCGSGVCKGTTNKTITVTSNPMVSIAPGSPSVCLGGSATLTATGCTNGQLLWSTGEITTSITIFPAKTDVYSVTCKNGQCVASAQTTVTVTPASSITAVATDPVTCGNKDVTLTVNGCSGIATWSNGLSATSITVKPTVTTTYTVTCTGTGSCTSVAQVQVTVSPQSNPNITASSMTVCPNEQVVLTVTGCSDQIRWSNNSTVASITVFPSQTQSYNVTCGKDLCTATKSIQIAVQTPSDPTVKATSTSICFGQSVTLTVENCQNPIKWNTGESATSITVSPTANSTPYTVECGTGSCKTTKTITINVEVVEPPVITATPTIICPGEAVTLTTNCDKQITWNTGSNSKSITVFPGANNSYSVTCGTGSCAKSNSVSVQIKSVNPITVRATKTDVCKGEPVTLTVDGCPSTVTWNINNVNGSTITQSPIASTTYTAYCGEGNCRTQASVTVNVSEVQQPIVSTSKSNICRGESVTLTATNCSQSVTWSPDNLTGNTVSVTPSETKVYTATCGTGLCKASASVTVTVSQAQKPVLTASPSSICQGESSVLTVSGCSGTVTWNDGLANGLSSRNVNPVNTTTYTVSCGTGACVGTASITITVNSASSPVITPSNPTVCAGECVDLTVSGCNGNAISWSDNLGSNSSARVCPTVTTTYKVTCGSGTCVRTSLVEVKVTPKQTPTLTANPSTICKGENTTLTVSGCSGTVTWNDSQASGQTSRPVTPSSTTTYSVTCGSGACAGTASVIVTVNTQPNPTITPSNPTVCSGECVALTVAGCSGTISWSNNMGSNSTASACPAVTTTYTVTCGSGSCIATSTVTVNVTPKQAPSLTASPSTICRGKGTVLTVTGCNGSIVWNDGQASGQANRTVTPGSTTTYSVTCGGSGSCSNPASVTVNVTNPTPPVITPNDPIICLGECITLTVSGCEGTIVWCRDLGGTSTMTDCPELSVDYTVTCLSNGGCEVEGRTYVKVLPKQNPVLTASPSTICKGENTTLTVNGCTDAIAWSDGQSSGQMSRTVTPSSTTTYSVTCGTGKCAGVSSVTINVNNPSSPVITPSNPTVCSGECVTLTVAGCSGAISWSNNLGSNSTASACPSTTTTYSVTCGSGSCTASSTVTVNVTPKQTPVLTTSPSTICRGESTTLTVSGCSGTVVWNDGQSSGQMSRTVTPSSTTTYSVTCGGGSCTGSASVTVTVTTPSSPVITPSNPTVCSGECVTLTVAGCSGAISWSNNLGSNSTASACPSTTTTYSVTCGSGSCTASSTVTVNVTPKQTPVLTTSPSTICRGESTTLTVSGCSGTVVWSDGQSSGQMSRTVTPSSTTTYSVTCGGGSCTGSASVTVTVTTPSSPVITPSNPTVCSGECVTLTVAGCSGAISWSNNLGSNSTASACPSTTTTYSVTCGSGSCTASSTVTVNVTPKQTPVLTTSPSTICRGESTTLTVSGCSGTVVWSDGQSSGQMSRSVTPSSTTTYSVTCGGGSCTGSASVTVTVTTPSSPVITPSNPTVCSGECVTLTVAGCSGAISWSNNLGSNSTASACPSTTTTYSVTCGSGSCTASSTVTVNVTPKQTPVLTTSPSTICRGESTTLTVSGCSGTVVWSDGQSSGQMSRTVTPSSTTTYSVTCGGGSCTGSASVTVTVTTPSSPVITPSNPTVCSGECVTLTVAGCSGAISWSNNLGSNSTASACPSTTTTYSVTCGSGSCTASSTVTVNVTPKQTPVLTTSPSTICRGESTTLTVSGCSGTVVWSDGQSSGQMSRTVTPSSTTTYSVTCGGGSCTGSASVTVTVTTPSSPVITPSNPTVCSGECVTLTVAGCSGAISWSNNLGSNSTASACPSTTTTYSVTCGSGSCTASSTVTVNVTPKQTPVLTTSSSTICRGESTTLTVSGCSGTVVWNDGQSSGQMSRSVTPSSTTTYSVTCGGGSCTGSASVTVTVTTPSSPVITPSNPTVCSGECVTLTVAGCSGAISWSNNLGSNSTASACPSTTTTYSVTCGSGSCTASSTVTVNVTPKQTPVLTTSPSTICRGESTTLTVSGCSGTVVWSDGQSSGQMSRTVTPSSTTTYSVTCGGGSCTGSASVTVTVTTPSSPVITPSNPTVCSGECVALTVAGCSGAISWSNNLGSNSTASACPSTTTTYSVTCGSGSCTASSTVTVNVTPKQTPVLTTSPSTICRGESTTLTVSGCSGTVVWSDGQSSGQMSRTVTPSSTTTYSVTCGGGSCTGSASVTVTVTTPSSPVITPSNPTVCSGECVTLTVAGCSGAISWSNNLGSNSTASACPSTTTTYSVTCGSGSCTASSTVTVNVTPKQIPVLTTSPSTICRGESTTLTVSGCSGTVVWSDGQSSGQMSRTVTPSSTTTYSVTCGGGSCTGSASVTVTVTTPSSPVITPSNPTVCSGECVTLTVAGCSGAISWSNNLGSNSTASACPSTTTTYSVTCGSGSCTASSTVTVNVTPKQTPVLTTSPSTICRGESTTLTVSGCSGTVVWSDGQSSGQMSRTVTPSSTTTYSVTCGGGSCTGSASVTVTVTTPSSPVITPSNPTVCSGECVTLTVAGCSGAISWSNNLGSNSTASACPSTTTTYSVTCGSGSCTASSTVTVNVTPKQTPVLTTSPSTICRGESTTLTVSGCSGTVVWSDGQSSGQMSRTVTPSSTTTYSVTCGGGSCTGSASVTVTVTTPSSPVITPSNPTVCSGECVTLTVAGCSGAISWSNNLGSNSTASACPSTTTTYSVTCGSGSCTASSTVTVNVTTPQIPVVNPDKPTVCSGEMVTLNATNCSGTIKWTLPSGEVRTGNSITLSATSGTTNIVVECANGTGTCKGTATYKVDVPPTSNISITTTNTSICKGSSSTLTVNGCNSGVVWSTGATTSSITVSPETTTNYSVTCGIGSSSCSNTAVTQIVVLTKENLIVTPSNPSICVGSNTVLTVSGCNVVPKWSNGTNGTSITVSPLIATTYTVTCGESGSLCSGTASVTVNVGTSSNPVITPNSQTICSGESTTLSISGCSGEIKWSTGASSSTISVNPTNTTTYTVTCGSGSCTGTTSVTVSVIPKQTPVLTANPSTICRGESTTLTVGGCNGAITWSDGAANGQAARTVTPTSTMTYTVTCGSGSCAGTASVTVTIGNPSNPAITPSSPSVCSGKCVTLTITGCSDNINWSNNLGSNSTISVCPTVTTTYSVSCGSGNCVGTSSVTVNITSPTVPTIVEDKNDVCPGTEVTLTASGCSVGYNWNTGEKTATIKVKPTATTTYVVTCEGGNGCEGSKNIEIRVGTGNGKIPTIVEDKNDICSGTEVTLTASGCSVGYNWNTGDKTATIKVKPTATTTYVVSCEGNNCEGSIHKEIRVGAKLIPTIVEDKNDVCPGTEVTLTASGCSVEYNWVTTGEKTPTIKVKPTQTTTYILACEGSSCEGAIHKEIRVSGGVPPSIVADKNDVCPGTEVTLTASGCSAGYNWSTGDKTATIKVKPTVNTTYVVTCEGGNGCEGSKNIEIRVGTGNGKIPTIVEDKNDICSGTEVTLTASGCSVGYNWNTGDKTATIKVKPTATTTYVVSCEGNNCEGSIHKEIRVGAKLIPTIVEDKNDVCPGTEVTLTASGCSVEYNWVTTGEKTPTIKVKPTQTTTYILACEGSSCEGAIHKEIRVSGGVPPSIVADKNDVCPGTEVTLTASGCSAGYNWSTGDKTATIKVKPTVNTTYVVTCEGGNGCEGSKNIEIRVGTGNGKIPTIVEDKNDICSGTEVTLTASGCSVGYNWNTGDKTATIKVKPTATTTYVVSCEGNNCEGSIHKEIRVKTGGVNPTIVADKNDVCSGTEVMLTASGCSAGYNWSTGEKTAMIKVKPTATTTYVVSCEGGSSCEGSMHVEVRVKTGGEAPAIVADKNDVCSGTPVTLTASGCSSGYAWSTNQTSNVIQVTPSVTTTYTVSCTGGCGGTASTTVNVGSGNVQPPTISSDGNISCGSGSATLKATGCENGIVVWSNGATGRTITVNPNVSTTYTATCVVNGCKSGNSNSVEVRNVGKPGGPMITCTSNRICAGQSLTLNAGGCEGGTITWYYNGQISTGSSLTIQPTETTAYVTTCKIGTCESEYSGAVTVTVGNPYPPLVQCSSPVICEGGSTELTASGCPYVTRWSNGMTGATITVSPTAKITTYTAVCENSSCVSDKSNGISVVVNSGSVATPVTTSLKNICPSETVDLKSGVTSTSASGNSFEYRLGATSTSPTLPNTTVSQSGTYYVFEKSGTGCVSTGAPIVVTITSCSNPQPGKPGIAITKSVVSAVNKGLGIFEVTYRMIVKNIGNENLSNVVVSDSLTKNFGSGITYTLRSVPVVNSNSTLAINTGFNGNSDPKMTLPTSTLPVGKADTLLLSLNVVTNGATKFVNQSWATGVTGTTTVTDKSNNSNNPDIPGGTPTEVTVNPNNDSYIGIAKKAESVMRVGTTGNVYDIVYSFVVKNYGSTNFAKVQVSDDLSSTFGSDVTVESVDVHDLSPGFTENTSYTGKGDNIDMLNEDQSSLSAGETKGFKLKVRINMGNVTTKTFKNTAVAEGYNGSVWINDQSNTGTEPDADGNGNPNNDSQPTEVKVGGDNPAPVTTIGISKKGKLERCLCGKGYDLTFTFVVKNYNNAEVTNVQVTDNLSKVFKGITYQFDNKKLQIVTSNGNQINSQYNGVTDTMLYASGAKLAPLSADTLIMKLKLTYVGPGTATYKNIAYVFGIVNGNTIKDTSVDGLNPDLNGDGNPGDDGGPTENEVGAEGDSTANNAIVYQAVSPNGDGKNDHLIIDRRTQNDPPLTVDDNITLEIYNRWGHLVYRSDNYIRDVEASKGWKGNSNTGIRVGSDEIVPDGTYYYVVNSTNKKLFDGKPQVNFITLKR